MLQQKFPQKSNIIATTNQGGETGNKNALPNIVKPSPPVPNNNNGLKQSKTIVEENNAQNNNLSTAKRRRHPMITRADRSQSSNPGVTTSTNTAINSTMPAVIP